MSETDTRKYYIGLVLCIIGVIGSGVGLFFGILLYLFEGDSEYLALLIITALTLLGSIIGIFLIAMKIRKLKGFKGSQDARLWLILSIVFFILAATSYFWVRYFGTIIVMAIVISVLSSLFLMSLFFVIINREQFRQSS